MQRKTLADVGVTLTSRGTFRFEKGRRFVWDTQSPLASRFVATPTNYAFTVNGRTSTHALENDISSVEQIFAIKEMRTYVKEVVATPPDGFPDRVRVVFRNGDTLAIELVRTETAP